MSAIPPYSRLANFTQYALDHTAAPYNASDHDAELDDIDQTVAAIIANRDLIQRNDGALANQTVHPDALSTATKAIIGAGRTGQLNWTPRGLWVTATAYVVGDVVENTGASYVCASAHTSGTFATDHTAGKWVSVAPATSVENANYTPTYGALAGVLHTLQSFLDKLAQGGANLGAYLLGYTPTTGALSGVALTIQSFLDKLGDAGTNLGAALVGFMQSGTGAVSESVQDALRSWVTPEMFGAVGDGVTDDTAAIQRAINYFTGYSGEVYLPYEYLISSTLTIDQKAVTLRGRGWGNSNGTRKIGFLKWNGAAGSPMVKLSDGFGAGIENIRFIGNSSAKPSAAIEVTQAGGGTNFGSYLSRLWIGKLYGLDTDNTNQFTSGIVFSGTTNGDSNTLQHIRITGCDAQGLDFQNANASDTHLSGVYIQSCDIGIKTKASLIGNNVLITNSATTDIQLETAGKFHCNAFVSESSARLCKFNGDATKLKLVGGSWQAMSASVAGDGRIIDTSTFDEWSIDIEGFSLQYEAAYSGATPVIRAYDTSGSSATTGYLRLVNTWGIYPANIDVGTMVDRNDSRTIIYEPAQESGQDPMPRQRLHLSRDVVADRTFSVWKNEDAGQYNLYAGPLNVRRIVPLNTASVAALSGSGATTYSYYVTALTYDGETTISNNATCTNAAALDSTHVNRVSWYPEKGARGFKVYGRSSGSELLLATVLWNDLHPGKNNTISPPHWDDDGSVTPSGALPTVNTTGNATVEGALTAEIGNSTSTGNAAVTANVTTVAIGNVGSGEDNLTTYSLPANSLGQTNKGVRITWWGQSANNASAKTLRFYFGTQLLATEVLTVNQASIWRAEALVFRTGASTQDWVIRFFQGGAIQINDCAFSTASQTDTSAITIKCTGDATSNNDIRGEGHLIEAIN